MSELAAGQSKTERLNVDTSRTIAFMGDDCRVYATPELVRDIEMTCRELLLEHIDEGQDSVGTRVAIDHLAATPLGMDVSISVEITALKGRHVTLAVECRDTLEVIARGTHERFVVDVAKTAERIRQKLERAGASR